MEERLAELSRSHAELSRSHAELWDRVHDLTDRMVNLGKLLELSTQLQQMSIDWNREDREARENTRWRRFKKRIKNMMHCGSNGACSD